MPWEESCYMKLNLIIVSVFALATAVTYTTALPVDVSATKSNKVTICHATNSHTNPYVVATVNTSSVNEKNTAELNGHGNHEGGVWYEGIADHSWGDIIPAFESPKGTAYAGQNMTSAGQVILKDGCKVGKKVSIPTPGNGSVAPLEKPVVETPKAAVKASVVAKDIVAEKGNGTIVAPVAVTELPETGAGSNMLGLAALLSASAYTILYALRRRFSLEA